MVTITQPGRQPEARPGGPEQLSRVALRSISVIVPAFNEAGSIAHTVAELEAAFAADGWDYELIVVDDASTDGTAELLAGVRDDRVQVMTHPANRGYGAALVTGIRAARHDVVAIIDADGTYPYDQLPALARKLVPGVDMVVGARTGQGAGGPWLRRPAKWLLRRLAMYLTGTRIPDLNSGMRVMRKAVVLQYRRLLPNNFSFTTTITLAMLTNHYSVAYVPIPYRVRTGRSKIRPIQDTFNFLQLIIRTIMYFAPLKVFLPISFLLFSATFASGVLDVVHDNLTDKTVLLFTGFMTTLAIGCLADLIDKRLAP